MSFLSREKIFKIEKIKKLTRRKSNLWKLFEDKILKEKAEENNFKNWKFISQFIPEKTVSQCYRGYEEIHMFLNKKTEKWTKEEDETLINLYNKYGGQWSFISRFIYQRTPSQIKNRYISINSQTKKFSKDEDDLILNLSKKYGNNWKKISQNIKGKTNNMVKSRFYYKLKNLIFNNGDSNYTKNIDIKNDYNDSIEGRNFDINIYENKFINNYIDNKSNDDISNKNFKIFIGDIGGESSIENKIQLINIKTNNNENSLKISNEEMNGNISFLERFENNINNKINDFSLNAFNLIFPDSNHIE